MQHESRRLRTMLSDVRNLREAVCTLHGEFDFAPTSKQSYYWGEWVLKEDVKEERRLKSMGRMKQMALELEEQFGKNGRVADRSETYLSFTSEMEGHMDMVSHLDLSAVHDMMAETWGRSQETAGKGSLRERGGL